MVKTLKNLLQNQTVDDLDAGPTKFDDPRLTLTYLV